MPETLGRAILLERLLTGKNETEGLQNADAGFSGDKEFLADDEDERRGDSDVVIAGA